MNRKNFNKSCKNAKQKINSKWNAGLRPTEGLKVLKNHKI